MKSALKKSVVSTSISLILASGMAAFAAHAADDVKLKATKTNINKSELKTMNSVQLTAQKKRISAKCQQCVYKPICNGGCPKHRITKVNNETVSYFCEGYKILFSTMVPYMNAMVELAKNRVPLYHIMDVAKQMENN